MLSALAVTMIANAQQQQGKVIYQRTIRMYIRLDNNDEISSMLPKSRTDRFELTFANNQSIWKHIDDADASDEIAGDNGSMHINFITPGQNDIVFCDFSLSKKVEQKEVFDKKFVVTDSITKLSWKLTGDTQTILNHVCRKAIAQKTGKRTEVSIDNGVMKNKEVNDTTNIVAWFTTDIPVSAGPEFPGELPGLILALEMNNGSTVYKATEISEKPNLAEIKEPTKGKKVTPDEFKAEREKLMDEMRKNNEGDGRRVLRIQNENL